MSFSREKIVVLSSLSSSFLSSSRSLSFLGGEKKKRKNIYLERSARFRSEREREYSHHHLRSRGTEGKETLAVITSSFSLFVVVVVRFAAGNVCHQFVTKKRVTEYFRDDRPKRERSEEK